MGTAALLVAAFALGACTTGDETAPTPPPTTTVPTELATPTATPTPSPTLTPVVGKQVRRRWDLSNGPVLGLGAATAPDESSVDDAYTRVADWLDRHLDRLQREGRGRMGKVAPEGLAPPSMRDPVTTDLASPDRPVASARYGLTAFHEGDVQMVTAAVLVRHPDGSASRAHFVFVVRESGKPVLALFGPEARPRGGG